MDIILSGKKINKIFRKSNKQQLHVLKDVDIDVRTNKISVIIGASGAGKSTLLHILSGLDKPDSGDISLLSENLSAMKDKQLASFRNDHIGFVFQFHHLLPEFTAAENVAIPMIIGGISKSDAISAAEEKLTLVGLSERLTHKPSELSGGEQQRVAIARALINDPQIIFADEPTGNLDSATSESIHQLLIKLRDQFKKTLLIVTHNPELMKIADVVIEMKDGKVFSVTQN
ncbi:MAG: lipoprotein-releasing system ATP-binding protein LolD [Melioribacteraceae bacterium]|nr:MAG: lipoprotein-releasing system ATP-binding protein LolD [Melioribacteraceae bacterium]